MHFFNNGGTDAYIIRLAKGGDATGIAATATAEAGGFTFEASSPGEWAHDYKIKVSPRPGVADRFKIEALLGDAVVESFENLSRDTASSRFVTDYIKDRSRIFKVTVVPNLGPHRRRRGHVRRRRGRRRAGSRTRMRSTTDIPALFDEGEPADKIDLFNIVCVPGMTEAAEISNAGRRSAQNGARS